jgi:polar amino acid transport system substrate-binding protein
MQAVHRDLVPGGTLRAAINFGNALVAQREAGSGEPRGLAVDLANELARRLSVSTSLLEFDGVVGILEAAAASRWDVAFLAIDPVHTQSFDFTRPYVVFEGTYLVHDDSPNRTVLDLDREGVRIAVSQGATYDRYLTRTLRHAQLVRSPTFKRALELFLSERLDAVAGLKQPLADFAKAHDGLHVIDGRFAAIEHAIAVPKGHSAGLRYLKAFIEEMKASGRVASSLERTADVADPAYGVPSR